MIYYLLLDRKERYPSCEDEDLPPRNDVGEICSWCKQDKLLTVTTNVSFPFNCASALLSKTHFNLEILALL